MSKIKLRTHPRNFCEGELIVNLDIFSREKFPVVAGDFLEVSVCDAEDKTDSKLPLILQVEKLPQDIQSNGGPLSISKELAVMFGLEGVKEVIVRKVESEEVGLDLVELRFKDQCLTRSDMWRFSCSLLGQCVYLTKKREFAGIRCQVSGLWSQGEQVQCGAIVSNTRVIFRSASAHFFIFIQISAEMWEFDSSGDLYFDKAEGGFLKELFARWEEEKCSHEVTIVFFWRIYYSKDMIEQLPSTSAVRQKKRGEYYEDFYKVIAQEEMAADWSSRLVDIKKHFSHLKELLVKTRGEDVRVSPASQGNILEAINLAVNVYEKSYQNCNFQLTGQQIVIVTPGVGVFEVERDLTMMTRERIIDTGVGVDLISLTEQPLHAVPLFKFHSSVALDNQEYYNLPHWINYSFYNPIHPWDRFRFRPKLKLSDHLITSQFKRLPPDEREGRGRLYQPSADTQNLLSPHTHSSSLTLKKIRALHNKLTSDDYDATIFTSGWEGVGRPIGGVGKVRSAGKLNLSEKKRTRHSSFTDHHSASTTDVAFTIAPTQDDISPFGSPESDVLSSPTANKSTDQAADTLHPTAPAPRGHYYSESSDPPSSSICGNASSHTLCPVGTAGTSADSLPKFSHIADARGAKLMNNKDPQITVTTKRAKFINPFDPSKVHGELTAYYRRWVHTFPRDRTGLAFQAHHTTLKEEKLGEGLEEEEEEEGDEGGDLDTLSTHTLSPPKGGAEFGGQSWSDVRGEEFRTLRQSGRSYKTSMSSSYADTLVQSSMGSEFNDVSTPKVESLVDQKEENQNVTDHSTMSNSQSQKVDGSDEVVPSQHKSSDAHSHQSGRNQEKQISLHSQNWDQKSGSSTRHKFIRTKATPPRTTPPYKNQKSGNRQSFSSEPVKKTVEDFTSIRRTGVDWKSLTEPACLPITVDFFPSKTKLEQEYYESPSKLVVSSYGSDTSSSTPTRNARNWIANHQKVSTFDAFKEMISQRLSQGFQLVFDFKDSTDQKKTSGSLWSGKSNLISIYSLHQALNKLKEEINQKSNKGRQAITGGSIVVRLSLGKVFQKLELAYPDIYIYIYKQKVLYRPQPFSYVYQLSGAGLASDHTPFSSSEKEAVFGRTKVQFEYYRAEEYNWNYLDQHVLGFSEFEELQESHKYWRCRYLLLPSSPPPDMSLEGGEERLMSRDITLISSFVRFVEFLNHVKRTQPISGRKGASGGRVTPQPPKLRRNCSLPASHLGSYTPSRGSSTPLDFNSLMSSPISIQSPYAPPRGVVGGGANVSRLSEIEESAPFSGPPSNVPLRSKTGSGDTSVTTPFSGPSGHDGRREFLQSPTLNYVSESGRDSKLSRKYTPSENPNSLRNSQSRDDVSGRSHSSDETHPSSPMPPGRGRGGREGSATPTMGLRGDSKDSSSSTSKSAHRRGKGDGGGGGAKVEKSPEIVVDDVSGSSLSTSSFDVSIHLVNSTSPPQIILKHMENAEEGIDFLGQHPGLGENCCFIGMEAVSWVLEKVGGVAGRKEAVKILQEMVKEQLILHASLDLNIPFLDGYYIYCVTHRMNQQQLSLSTSGKDDFERSFLMVSPEYEAFSRQWFEVAIEHPSAGYDLLGGGGGGSSAEYSPSPSPYSGFSPYAKSPYAMDYTSRLFNDRNFQSARVNRSVELNPDPLFKSDRPEWCFVHYDRSYHPHKGFQFEMQWMVSTITLFNQLIQNWTHKAAMCGFNLVPVPTVQTLCREKDSHPFGSHQYIPLQLPSAVSTTSTNLGEAVGSVMMAIMMKLGFIMDPGSTQEDLLDYNVALPLTTYCFAHYSGHALLRPTCADSVIRLMDRQRRYRTSSMGTTLGRGDFTSAGGGGAYPTGHGDMGQDYTDELVGDVGGGAADTLDGGGWFRSVGSTTQQDATPHNVQSIDDDVFQSRSRHKGVVIRDETTPPSSLECGFYWYKNTALFRHKAATTPSSMPTMLSEYNSLRERLVALCSNTDGKLSELCATALGLQFSNCSSDSS